MTSCFASLDDIALPKWGVLWRKECAPGGTNSVPYKSAPFGTEKMVQLLPLGCVHVPKFAVSVNINILLVNSC